MWTYVPGVGWMHLLLTNSNSHTVSKRNVQLKVRINNREKGARGILNVCVPRVLSSSVSLAFRPSFCLDTMYDRYSVSNLQTGYNHIKVAIKQKTQRLKIARFIILLKFLFQGYYFIHYIFKCVFICNSCLHNCSHIHYRHMYYRYVLEILSFKGICSYETAKHLTQVSSLVLSLLNSVLLITSSRSFGIPWL